MALIIEDGTLVANANSYVTTSELTDYATARGITITGDEEELLIRAMDYFESLAFIGIKVIHTQALQWPRANVIIDDYLVELDTIPSEVIKSQIEIALAIDNGQDPAADVARSKSKVKVGELEVTYEPGQSTTIVRKISNSIWKLLVGGVSGISFLVDRG